jgi:hypothetical protein
LAYRVASELAIGAGGLLAARRTQRCGSSSGYSHDSDQHDARVLELSNRLRTESGIDCRIDQYEFSPPEGWQPWVEET